MSVKTVLDALKSHEGLSNLVSNRIYRFTTPQNPTFPLILFDTEEQFINTLAGKSSLNNWMFEFEIKSKDLSMLSRISQELQSALGSGSFSTVIQGISDDDHEDELGNFTSIVEASVWF